MGAAGGVAMKVLVVDVGGSHVKMLATGKRQRRKFKSGSGLVPGKMVAKVLEKTADWSFDVISIGFPSLVTHGRIATEPFNLGAGWVGFDFPKAFGCPVKVINDAAMQALGSYEGGRMLFLGFGTGLGTAMIVDGVLDAMELGHLPYKKGRSYEDYVGAAGLERMGLAKWRAHAWDVIAILRKALEPDYVVVGGGNAKRLRPLRRGVRMGANSNAFVGGFRMWKGR